MADPDAPATSDLPSVGVGEASFAEITVNAKVLYYFK